MKIIGLLVLAFVMSGCAALAAPGIEGAASLAGMAGNSATGYMSTHSSIELNAANVELVKAQAQMQKVQADDLRNKREELEDERAATVGILREGDCARGSHARRRGAVGAGGRRPRLRDALRAPGPAEDNRKRIESQRVGLVADFRFGRLQNPSEPSNN